MAVDWNNITSETRRCIPIELHKYTFDDRTVHKVDFIEPISGEKYSAQYDPSYWSSFPLGVPGDYIFKRHHYVLTDVVYKNVSRNVPSYTLMLVGQM